MGAIRIMAELTNLLRCKAENHWNRNGG